MYQPSLNARSRVMMFAPHPDDESLAAGIFLQRAVAVGADIRLIYGTDGEKNCWPQRLLERKARIGEADRHRWGKRRQAEALAALRVLEIGPEQVEFLSLPDQGITDLLLEGGGETIRRLADLILAWGPTHLLVPSASDTHPDHSGLAVLLRFAFDNFLPRRHGIERLDYLVHGGSASFADAAGSLPQTSAESARKKEAISRHLTQVAFSRRRFLAYAKRPERFVVDGGQGTAAGHGPILSCERTRDQVHLQVAFELKPLRAEETTLHLIGQDSSGALRSFRATLPGRPARLELIDHATGETAGVGRYQGDAFRAEIFLPAHAFALHRALHLKLNRRVWFFDEAGWLELAPLLPAPLRVWTRPPATRELAVA